MVVPVYKQPQFLSGAVLSALEQHPPVAVRVAIVNDGCPFTTTHEIGQALALGDPDRVLYVRQENAGLSAARNEGIAQLLARWPEIAAIFPLDADNLLSPHSLARLWERLADDPRIAWAAPDLERFGEESGVWRHPSRFSVYRQLHENQADAGTLIRREVFDSGLRYEPNMPAYEDWLFLLQAALRGYMGVAAGECGFLYRRQAHSLLQDAREDHEALIARLRACVPDAYAPAALARREHDEAPRYALVRTDQGEVGYTAATDLAPADVPLEDFLAAVEATVGGTRDGAFVPPITVAAEAQVFAWLRARGLLPGLLVRLQAMLQRHVRAELAVVEDPALDGLALAAEAYPAALVACRTRDLATAADVTAGATGTMALHAGPGAGPPRPARAPELPAAGVVPARNGRPADRTLSSFSGYLHVDTLETSLPWAGDGPRLVLACRDLHAPLAGLLPVLGSAGSVHALLAPGGGAVADARPDSLSWLDGGPPYTGVFASLAQCADVVVYAGSSPLLDDLLRGARPDGLRASLLCPGDDPVDIGRAGPLLDLHLVAAGAAGDRLIDLGVVPETIVRLDPADAAGAAEALATALAVARERR